MALSRQREWQEKKVKAGLCSTCGDPQIHKSDRCFRHHALRVLAGNGLGSNKHQGKWGIIHQNHRTNLISLLWGRYHYTKTTGSPPEAVVTWDQVKFGKFDDAAAKLEHVILMMDRKAIREYGARVTDG